jgi:hypothetical protein
MKTRFNLKFTMIALIIIVLVLCLGEKIDLVIGKEGVASTFVIAGSIAMAIYIAIADSLKAKN